ncbi:MAG: amino acid permease [Pyrinomonadaceae bacterium]
MNITDLFRKKSVDKIQADAESGFSDAEGGSVGDPHLRRSLKLFDLTLMGVAAIVGAGIFAMIGKASFDGGPAVVFLFVFTAIACAFSALCYAEFASRLPVAGSAYTYAYASFGELFAWIIGWDLIVEYAIGNIAVAISWSDYFTGWLEGIKIERLGINGIHIPFYFTMDFLTARRGFDSVTEALGKGGTVEALTAACKNPDPTVTCNQLESYSAWANAPHLGALPIICDLPALLIVILITALVYVGIRESKVAGNVMTVLKIGVILMVIFLGMFYVNPANWSPFAPNGVTGVMKGVSAVFFAYIGFDALSTTAEECQNPRRDLPLAMMMSLVICTVLYIALALVLTGMVSYKAFENVGDPLAFVFTQPNSNLPWVSGIIAISAVIALATVFLVFQIGQPRLWMAMSRDGLLPKIFSSIHPRFKTPWFATIITGIVVAVPALFMNLTEVTDLASIGTLFAFVLVCGGVLVKDKDFGREKRYVPYIDSQFIAPAIFLIIMAAVLYFNPGAIFQLTSIDPEIAAKEGVFGAFTHKIPFIVFLIFSLGITVLCIFKRLTLIPVLGVISCAYLMTELGVSNWSRFGAWLLLGLGVYFRYGYVASHIGKEQGRTAAKASFALNLASISFILSALGLAVIAFSFVADIFVYLIPNLSAETLWTVAMTIFIGGLVIGIIGVLSEFRKSNPEQKPE